MKGRVRILTVPHHKASHSPGQYISICSVLNIPLVVLKAVVLLRQMDTVQCATCCRVWLSGCRMLPQPGQPRHCRRWAGKQLLCSLQEAFTTCRVISTCPALLEKIPWCSDRVTECGEVIVFLCTRGCSFQFRMGFHSAVRLHIPALQRCGSCRHMASQLQPGSCPLSSVGVVPRCCGVCEECSLLRGSCSPCGGLT